MYCGTDVETSTVIVVAVRRRRHRRWCCLKTKVDNVDEDQGESNLESQFKGHLADRENIDTSSLNRVM
jgi:hypothetical protein